MSRKTKKAIIFLDIDGVVNTYNHLKSQRKATGTFSHENWCPVACQNIWQLCNMYKAKIVVSSSWRLSHTLPEIRKIFTQNGLPGGWVIGVTPDITQLEHVWESPYWDTYCRGLEIQEWLLLNDSDCNYLIIDDDADMLNHHQNRFVRVDSEVGFADKQAFNKAVDILDHERSLKT